jgi:hypothetical protein
MSNPWLKKNPFLSMWMSGANSIAGSMRGQAKRHATIATTQAANEIANFWAKALTPRSLLKKTRR